MLPIEVFRRRRRGSAREQPNPRSIGDSPAILLVAAKGQRQVVSACCQTALRAGVRPGMSIADARSAFPPDKALVAPDDAARTASALLALGHWAHRFSPRVALNPPDGLLLDITGCQRALGGEEAIVCAALSSLERFGVHAVGVIAPTYSGAAALARYAVRGSTRAGGGVQREPHIITDSELRSAIEPLPVAALGIDGPTIAALAEVGIERLGQLIDLPRSVLPARFGDQVLLRLDRMLGRGIETIEPMRPDTPIRAALALDGPTHHMESIEAMVRSLVRDLCDQLAARELGALRLLLTLVRSDMPPATLLFTMARPTRDPAHLWSLIRPRLERTHLGFGIESVEVHAQQCGRIAHTQRAAWGDAPGSAGDDEALARLIDGLTNRMGRDRVLRGHRSESHRPERSAVYRPAVERDRVDIAQRESAPSRCVPPPRPTLLFDRPEPAEVIALTPDGPVHRIVWRESSASVLACLGPERIGPEWWRVSRRRARTRDYFAIQDERGRWLWVFRELESSRWFVHGVWG